MLDNLSATLVVRSRSPISERRQGYFCAVVKAQVLNSLNTPMLLLSSNHLCDGGLLFSFMDRRHLEELFLAGREASLSVVDLCVWGKMSGGMGSFYRSQHEPSLVFKSGKVPFLNNIITRARKILNWAPAISLDEGLRPTVAYFSDRLKGR